MRKTAWIIIALIALLLSSFSALNTQDLAVSADAYTSPFTTPPAGALIVPDDYPTIQAAIGNASAGDTVFVKEGTYNYNRANSHGSDAILVDKPISLIGEDSQKTIIKMEWFRYSSSNVIHITADNVTISGFTITSDYGLDGINIEDRNSIDVRAQPLSGVKIIGNNIVGNYGGITGGGEKHIISQNNITGARNGISLAASDSVISDNNITGNLIGLEISLSQNVLVKGNNIVGNGGDTSNSTKDRPGGLSLWLGANNIYVYGNNITDNRGFGVQFSGLCNNSAVYNNDIMRNDFGIDLRNFPLTTLFSSVGSGNKVYSNNLIGNSQNAFVEHAYPYNVSNMQSGVIGNGIDVVMWDNGKVGNYWDDYLSKYPNATEVDASEIGNTPYFIDANNTDHYPLMRQVDIYAPVPTPTPTTIAAPNVTELLNQNLWLILIIVLLVVALAVAFVVRKRRNKKG